MRLPRLFVEDPPAVGRRGQLPERAAHHAQRVLRLRDGAAVVLFDGQGAEYPSHLVIERGRALVQVLEKHFVDLESPLQVRLIQAWIATEKLDWVVEKAVELGVDSIVVAAMRRSVVQLSGERLERRLAHLREVIVSACAQCGRNRLPALAAADSLQDALRAGCAQTGLLLDSHAATPLQSVTIVAPVAIVVGPEGGFEPAERELASALGYRPVVLGPRTLRTETAGLAALAALQTLNGDLS